MQMILAGRGSGAGSVARSSSLMGSACGACIWRARPVTIAGSPDQASVDATAAELESLGARTLRLTSDVQDRASLQRLCDETVLAFGQVDILVVTAGALKKAPSIELTEEDWTRV